MPTSWNKPPQQGFTLLELLVALVIISLMTAVVGFSVSGNNARALKGEGDKLAARLNAAHAQMNAGASPMRLVATPTGYAFERNHRPVIGAASEATDSPNNWQRIADDEVLAARSLPSGASVRLKDPLRLAREPVTAPAEFTLVQGDAVVKLATNGVLGWGTQ
jgi:type II secretion system protein H